MAQVEATTERIVAADADTVFDALADYSGTRAKLLPEQFSEYEVREGGDGEGTLVHWKLQATSKRVRDCLLEVTEPTDGELVEKDVEAFIRGKGSENRRRLPRPCCS